MNDEESRERLRKNFESYVHEVRITASEPIPNEEDFANTVREANSLEQAQKVIETEGKRRDLEARTRYVDRVYWLIVYWLVFVAVVVIQDARQPLISLVRFNVSDPVLIALITTTTINVIGLFIVVLRYLFPHPETPPAGADQASEPNS